MIGESGSGSGELELGGCSKLGKVAEVCFYLLRNLRFYILSENSGTREEGRVEDTD